MMAFEFGGLTLEDNKKNVSTLKAISTCRLFSKEAGSEGHVLILTDNILPPRETLALSKAMSRTFPKHSLDIVSLTGVTISQEDLKKEGVLKFFKSNRLEAFKDYIKPGQTQVITMGRAIYGLNLALDVNIEDFYDDILGLTHYYSQETGTYVFPIDGFEDLFKMNKNTSSYEFQQSSKVTFAFSQFTRILSGEYKKPNMPTRPSIVRINSYEEAEAFFKKIPPSYKVAWDIETSGFDYLNDKIGCITVSFDGRTGYYIPWEYVNVESFNSFLSDKYQIGQNLKFDCKFARAAGVTNAKVHSDTMILGQTLGSYKSNSLKALAYYYTPYGGYDRELDEYLEEYKPASYLEIPEKILSRYATMDAIVSFLIHEELQKMLTQADQKNPPKERGAWTTRAYYEKIRIPAVNAFIDIEMQGIHVDIGIWDRNSKIAIDRLSQLTNILKDTLHIDDFLRSPKAALSITFGVEDDEEAEEEILHAAFDNEYFKVLNSPAKLGKLLEWNEWPDYGRSKSGCLLTGDDQLIRWEKEGRVDATKLKEFRSYRTLIKTFLGIPGTKEGWRKYIRQHSDGSYRIHPTYRVMGAESGRNTCDSPNWQQIPSGSIGAELVKQIVSTPDNDEYYLATLDYSSLQIRLAAIDSQDPYLCKIYREDPDADLHSITAFEVFCRGREFEVEEVTVTEGSFTKTFFAYEEVKVIRNGVEQKVLAKDLIETDELVL